MHYRVLVVFGVVMVGAGAFLGIAGTTLGQENAPAAGIWRGSADFAGNAADMSFEIDSTAQVVNGMIRLAFTYPGMTDELSMLMQEHGCIVAFNAITADSRPVAGVFDSAEHASGTFAATQCDLQGYGALEFVEPLTGSWQATVEISAAESPTQATRPTRVPTLDPSQPTAAPTRVPALDSTEPTARPTRMPTLDPNQPTAMPAAANPSDATDAPAAETVTQAEETAAPETVAMSTEAEYPNDPPGPHPNDGMSGRQLYKEHCEECHGQQGVGSEDAPELEALNARTVGDTVREGPDKMDVFTHDDIPDRQLNVLIDYVLMFHPDSEPRTEIIITED